MHFSGNDGLFLSRREVISHPFSGLGIWQGQGQVGSELLVMNYLIDSAARHCSEGMTQGCASHMATFYVWPDWWSDVPAQPPLAVWPAHASEPSPLEVSQREGLAS